MIPVLYSYPDFHVLYKPAGLDFHSSGGRPGFFRLLQEQMPDETLYPVHRLDKVTSGLILAARSQSAAAELGDLFSRGGMEKYYLALSDKKPRKKQGSVKGDMVRSRRGGWKLTRGMDSPALTAFFSRSLRPGLRLFLVRIYSGKTHQIRVALKSMGSPVLGDPQYYASGPAADRTYLHAWRLRFLWKDQRLDFLCSPREGCLFRPDEGFCLPAEWERPEDLRWPVL